VAAQACTALAVEEPGRSAYSRPQAPTCQVSSTSIGSPAGGSSTDCENIDSSTNSRSLSVGMIRMPSRIQSQI